MTFEYKTEKELCAYLKTDFKFHFGCDFAAEEYHLYGGRADFIGESDDSVFIIEVKKDSVTNESVKQLQKYMRLIFSDKKAFGILAAPNISADLDYSLLGEYITVKKIGNVSYVPKKKTSVGIPSELRNEIHKYMEQAGIKTWNAALWELVRAGLEARKKT